MNKDKIMAVFRSRERFADEMKVKKRIIDDWFFNGYIPPKRCQDVLMCDANTLAPESMKLVYDDLIKD
jgi:hypothetical protein